MGWHSDPPVTVQGLRWAIFWIALLAGLGVFDAWRATKADGSTLSEVTRMIFKVDRAPGRAVFLMSLSAGAALLATHILKHKLEQ